MKQNNTGNAFVFLAVLLVGGLLIAGCQPTSPSTNNQGNNLVNSQAGNVVIPKESFDPGVEITTNSFKTEEEYLAFIKSRASGGGMYMDGLAMRASLSSAPSAAVSESADSSKSGGAGNDFSGTNNQVSGVDEADIIKTDGEYIYTISGSTVFIVKAYPGTEAKVVSEIKLKDYPQGLFIQDGKLAVFGQVSDFEFFKTLSFRPRNQMSFFNVYDISDKAKPKLEKEYKVEGYYQQARQTGEYAYFVTLTSPEYRRDYPTPILMDGTTIRSMPVSDIHYFPIPYSQVQLATVTAINLKDLSEELSSKSVAVEYGQTLYMNEKNLYLTYTEYVNEWEMRNKILVEMMSEKFTDVDKALVNKIKDTDSDVLSDAEKDSKILNIAYDYMNYMGEKDRQEFDDAVTKKLKEQLKKYEYGEYTIINKLSIDGSDIKVVANGKVPGHIMNQFSMDEHDNVFRIATTVNTKWSSYLYEDDKSGVGIGGAVAVAEPAIAIEGKMAPIDIMPRFEQNTINNIYTLDEDLKVLDSLTGLAKGESIYSTRFIENRLYMVTYRQVDPFFVIDLSDAKNIKELGMLKIPGFSRYLHPYSENVIIGIGRDASEDGQQRGLKISLFDVSDVAKPKEIAKFVAQSQYAESIAEYEHKAFLFDKEKQLLVIPAYSYNYGWDNGIAKGQQGFNGAMVFNITSSDIKLRGVIDHSQGNQQYWGPTVQRSLFINELLYTKSEGLLRINKLSDLSKVLNIELQGYESPYPIY